MRINQPLQQSKPTNSLPIEQSNSIALPIEKGQGGSYEPDFSIFKRLHGRIAAHRRAATKLQRTPYGRAVFPLAERLFSAFWDEQIAAAIYGEHVNQARWMLKRRGSWTAWFLKHSGMPIGFLRGFSRIKAILAQDRCPGRPSQERFHDIVAACALKYRAAYGEERVPTYEPLARFLELPEFGYRLTARRVHEIANKVVRSFAIEGQENRSPNAFRVCGEVGDALLRQGAGVAKNLR